jgi:chemotaxis protein methyltransferase CheR
LHRRRRKRLHGKPLDVEKLLSLVRRLDAAVSELATDKTDDIEIRLLLEALFLRFHYDFRHYAPASLKRRLVQAREQMGFATFSALQETLLYDSTMLPRLLRYLTVQVSEMFRDPSYFRAIREKVIPHLFAEDLVRWMQRR